MLLFTVSMMGHEPATKTFCIRRELWHFLAKMPVNEGRIIGVAYRKDRENDEHLRLRRLVLRIRRERRDAPQLWVREAALVELVLGRHEKAVRLIVGALERRKGQDLYNDLAVAYFGRGIKNNDPYDYVLALSCIEKSLRMSNSREEILFNKSIILNKLTLDIQGEIAWQRYLASLTSVGLGDIENHSSGSAPALTQGHVAIEIENASAIGDETAIDLLVRRYTKESRHFAEELLEKWALAHSRGDTESLERLKVVLTAMGRSLSHYTGDASILDAFRVLYSIGKMRDASIVEAHLYYARSRRLYDARDLEKAKDGFIKSRATFQKYGSPLVEWVDYYLAACLYFEKEYDSAFISLGTLLDPSFRGNSVSRGSAFWLAGLMRLEKAEPEEAIRLFYASRRQFEATHEEASEAAVLHLIASSLDYLGQSRLAWHYRYKSFIKNRISGDREYRSVIFSEAARALSRSGIYESALAFQNEAINIDRSLGDPLAIAEGLWWRGMIHQRNGCREKALRDLQRARSYAEHIRNESIKDHTVAGIMGTEGAVLEDVSPESSIEMYNKALAIHERYGFTYALLDSVLGRGRASLRANHVGRAEADFLRGISELERQKDALQDDFLKSAFIERSSEVFGEMVLLQVDKKSDIDSGFSYSERGKLQGMFVLPSKACQGEVCYNISRLQKTLPKSVAIIHYLLVKERLLVWMIGRDGVQFRSLSFNPQSIERFRARILSRDNKDDFYKQAANLYTNLISHLRLGDSPLRNIVIVPDGELWNLPFAALRNPESGRFLGEEYLLSVIPSATAYSEAGWNKFNDYSLLLVGDPAFDRLRFPLLARLPEARQESEHVASIWPNHKILLGASATADNFVQNIDQYEIVQYSGHALVNRDAPLLSKLVFAPSNMPHVTFPSGELYYRDIVKLNLKSVRLVVLAACDSGQGEAGEGSLSLARAFLSAGSPVVLASSWKVDDYETRQFLEKFYMKLKELRDPALSLQAVQRQYISSSDPELRMPYAWSAFFINGAV